MSFGNRLKPKLREHQLHVGAKEGLPVSYRSQLPRRHTGLTLVWFGTTRCSIKTASRRQDPRSPFLLIYHTQTQPGRGVALSPNFRERVEHTRALRRYACRYDPRLRRASWFGFLAAVGRVRRWLLQQCCCCWACVKCQGKTQGPGTPKGK